jgi:hypothetical protein
VRIAGGVAGRVLRPTATSPLGLGVRADGLLLSYRVARVDNPSVGSSVVAGMTGLVEGSWALSSSFSALIGAGVEVAFGPIRVFVDDRATTTIGAFRGVAELGLRWEP